MMEYSDEDSYTFPGNRKSMTSYLDEYFKSLKRFARIEEKFITVFILMIKEICSSVYEVNTQNRCT